MTAPRLARGGRGKIFIYLAAILTVTGIVAIFHSTRNEIDVVRKFGQECQHQQESLSAQMQVIIEYKARLEKSLQAERLGHEQTRNELHAKAQDAKALNDKQSLEESLRLSTLQQHYKLLQSQHDDLAEECSNTKQQHLVEINNMQARQQEIKSQLKQAHSDKEKNLEHLKSINLQLQVDKERLQENLEKYLNIDNKADSAIGHLKKENYQLQKELDFYKAKCKVVYTDDQLYPVAAPVKNKTDHSPRKVLREFSKQVRTKENMTYQIKMHDEKPLKIINSVENFQIFPKQFQENSNQIRSNQKNERLNVLQQPNIDMKTSTSTTPKTNVRLENGAVGDITSKPLQQPTGMTRDVDKYDRWMSQLDNDENPIEKIGRFENKEKGVRKDTDSMIKKSFPVGVLPIPKSVQNDNDVVESPNLFRNIERKLVMAENEDRKADEKSNLKLHDVSNELDHGAHEVVDANMENINFDNEHIADNPNNQPNVDNFNKVQDNAEEDTFNVVDNKPLVLKNSFPKPNVKTKLKSKPKERKDTIKDAANSNLAAGIPAIYADAQQEGPDYAEDDKALDEIAEDDDDPDEYDSHLIARQKDPAVRN